MSKTIVITFGILLVVSIIFNVYLFLSKKNVKDELTNVQQVLTQTQDACEKLAPSPLPQ